MIYTCYEMIRDCRADRLEGWTYFLAQYVPVIRALLEHYFPERADDAGLVERVLAALRQPESSLFQSLDPAPERAFVSELRQRVLNLVRSGCAGASPEVSIDLETLGPALDLLTVTEKLAVWFETMRYNEADTGRMLRMSPQTVEKIRDRAAELLRGSVDRWQRNVLAENGSLLGQVAAARATEACLVPKTFFDVIDGRATWRGREDMERHVRGCWHCLDHFCRLLETVDVLRAAKPLAEAEVEPYKEMLGLPAAKRPFWKRMAR